MVALLLLLLALPGGVGITGHMACACLRLFYPSIGSSPGAGGCADLYIVKTRSIGEQSGRENSDA